MTEILHDIIVRERYQMILPIIQKKKTISEVSRETGHDRKMIRKHMNNFILYGLPGLKNKPRGKSNQTTQETKELIKEIKIEKRSRSTRKIRDILDEDYNCSISRQTIWRTLRKDGISNRILPENKVYRRFEYRHPNACWQMDWMEKKYVENIGIVNLFLIEDDYSRFGIGGEFFKRKNEDNALKVLREAFEKYGLPDGMIYDRDPMFIPARGGKNAKTKFGEILELLVIEPRAASSGHDETKGKIEKLIHFVENDFLPEGETRSLKDLNDKFRIWFNNYYNTKHKHSALDNKTPASRYVNIPMRKPFVNLDDVFCRYYNRKVRKDGTISFKGKIFPILPEYVRQKLELRILDGKMRIFFENKFIVTYDISIDYRTWIYYHKYQRTVRKNGYISVNNRKYRIGKKYAGEKVELNVLPDHIRIYVRPDRLIVKKLSKKN